MKDVSIQNEIDPIMTCPKNYLPKRDLLYQSIERKIVRELK
jgi:hypothetical protein